MNNNIPKTPYNFTGYMTIFSKNDWEELDAIMNNVLINAPEILETPQSGDSRDEYVDLCVARFIVRKNGHSETVNKPYSTQILNILNRSNFVTCVEQQTGLHDLSMLRMQLNSMKKDSVLGLHTDKESDSAFEVTAIIRTHSSYTGGELCLYGDTPTTVIQKNHTVFLMNPSLEHEVKAVAEGCRNSLVVFLGKA